MTSTRQLDYGKWAIPKHKAIVSFNVGGQSKDLDNVPCRDKGCKTIGPISKFTNYTLGGDIVPWGLYNDFPQRIQYLLDCDKDAPHLLTTNYNFLIGKGICGYQKIFEDQQKKDVLVQSDEFDNFKESLGCFAWDEYSEKRGRNIVLTHNGFTEMILNKGKNYPNRFGEVSSMQNIDGCNIRAGVPNRKTGRIEFYRIYSEAEPGGVKVPAFDPKNPHRYSKFIVHSKTHTVGHLVYGRPDFIGALDSLQIRQYFNKYHIAGFKNGWSIKYHIEISMKVLNDIMMSENSKKKEAKNMTSLEEIQERIVCDLEEQLSGVHNNQSNVITKYVVDADGHYHGIKITPLKNEISGEQYLELAKFSQQNNAPSFGLSNALAGIETQGKLGNAAELRNHINYHVTYKAYNMRKLFLRDLKVIKLINGWNKDIHFKIEDHPQPVTSDIKRSGLND